MHPIIIASTKIKTTYQCAKSRVKSLMEIREMQKTKKRIIPVKSFETQPPDPNSDADIIRIFKLIYAFTARTKLLRPSFFDRRPISGPKLKSPERLSNSYSELITISWIKRRFIGTF